MQGYKNTRNKREPGASSHRKRIRFTHPVFSETSRPKEIRIRNERELRRECTPKVVGNHGSERKRE